MLILGADNIALRVDHDVIGIAIQHGRAAIECMTVAGEARNLIVAGVQHPQFRFLLAHGRSSQSCQLVAGIGENDVGRIKAAIGENRRGGNKPIPT